MKSEAVNSARNSRKTGTAGRGPTREAMHPVTGTITLVLGPRPRGGAAADGGSEEEEMTDVQGNVGGKR
jgi:hypothetical protein